jgi:hypothetical protein
MATTVRDVLQTNGWWLKRGVGQSIAKKPTHLLLDGGRAHVPEASEGQFLSEYVLVLARNAAPPPAVVELRTPVFRMFMDVDAKLPLGAACDFEALWTAIYTASAGFFAEVPRMVVCTAPVKTDADTAKHGAHLIWPELWVRAEVAMAFRDALIPALREAFGDDLFANGWEDIVDACVYKANGLRMPWSVKGHGEGRPYTPAWEVTADGAAAVPPVTGVTALRTWVQALSIRAHGKTPSPLQEHVVVPEAPLAVRAGGRTGTSQPLEAYAHVLPLVDTALPPEFKPQRFTGLFRTPNSVMLRSTSHFCRNLGRAHRSNTVFFVVHRDGVSQKCFCRCETTDERKYGMCREYESEAFPVPQEAIDTLLGAAAAAAPLRGSTLVDQSVAALPSQKSKSLNSLNSILSLGVKSRGGSGASKRFKK